MSRLEHELKLLTKEFMNKAISEIEEKNYFVNISSSQTSSVPVTNVLIKNGLKTLCPSNEILVNDLIIHFRELQKFIPFCSSPKSFHSAWELRSEDLNKHTADRLVNEGAQLIPENAISERIFPHKDQQGVALGINKRLITAVRHSKGNYDDRLSPSQVFTYQPPRTVPGMLRYRWCEFLSYNLKFSYMLIAVMWLNYEITDEKNVQVYIIAPAKIIRPENNLEDLSKTLQNPLELQIVNRSETYSSLNFLESLHRSPMTIKMRTPLPKTLEEQWSYDEIHDSKSGRQIKKWYKEHGEMCPGCDKKFAEFSDSDIAFGHIVPQDWASTFPHHLSSVHHPDNLYLTCKICNSSLSSSFPNNNQTSQTKIEKAGTIGDWVRSNIEPTA